jgi:hypothetical protein
MEELFRMLDYSTQVRFKQQLLLDEAAQERLAAQLPRRESRVRRGLALPCYQLAARLEAREYVQPSESVREDWAHGGASI